MLEMIAPHDISQSEHLYLYCLYNFNIGGQKCFILKCYASMARRGQFKVKQWQTGHKSIKLVHIVTPVFLLQGRLFTWLTELNFITV